MKVAIIGTVGVPANYGGFETLVENLLTYKQNQEIEYTVYCSSKSYKEKLATYKGAKLIYLPLKANGWQSTIYDAVSIAHAAINSDILLILGVSGCLFLPIVRLFCRKKIVVNIDGLEHCRQKWGTLARWFLKISEAVGVRCANIIITDNKAIQDYVAQEYKKTSELIEYGGDHVVCDTLQIEKLVMEKYNIERQKYSFAVCRIEPENNVHVVLEAFEYSNEKILFVGNWEKNEYGKALWRKYKNHDRIRLLKPIYDLKLLNVFRSNTKWYIHGHSAGGTNPSLVEAMYSGCPIIAFDCVYNRETTENKAIYFRNAKDLAFLINGLEVFIDCGKNMLEIAQRRYCWKVIADKYNKLWLENT